MGRRSSSSSSEEGSLSDQSESSKGSRRKNKSKSRSSSSSRSRSPTPRCVLYYSNRDFNEKICRKSRDRQPPKHTSASSLCLSRYYKEHFGNHSPEVYMNLRISGFRKSLGKEEVIDILEKELKKLAPFEVEFIS